MKKVIFAGALLALLSACTNIGTGNGGVETFMGEVSEEVKTPGPYVTFFDTVYEISGKEVSFAISNLTPKSADNLKLQDFDADIYYRVNISHARKLYVKYQGDMTPYEAVVSNKDAVTEGGVYVIGYNRVLREAREAAYRAVAQFNATTMHTQRTEIGEAIRSELQKELDKTDPGSFTVTGINVRNLLTDEAIETAIRQQVAMNQKIIAKEKEIDLERKEAARKLEQARGEAAANAVLSQSLTPQLVDIRLAEIRRSTIVQAASKPGNTVVLDAERANTIVNTK
jgi:prohibitin 1